MQERFTKQSGRSVDTRQQLVGVIEVMALFRIDARPATVAIHLHYPQHVFRQLLAIERARARRAGRAFAIVLLRAKATPEGGGRIERRLGEKLFAILRRCLRDSDQIGWYIEERVVGVILTELNESVPVRAVDVERRLVTVLEDGLGFLASDHLQIRVLRSGSGLGK